ncbi:glyoxylate/hydroxypyruvate reductase A [Rhodopseudomonas julia]|uniref:Glyoxylate/hydroxypyruvate reductase A n=1 Tax=Rhodopseudomonas julia TaxID=200617 RepID=A0ABU0C2D1_9BRAD|nr:glyoxylate/hydroxypyruvate reductase A [Rhodopseudomonas julia]MDQ0324675.1 glyoxylate/hydroxypyruvate reductase A [Rhodopseudomonas julia]
MRIVFHSQTADPVAWGKALAAELPGAELRVWPNVGDPNEIDALLVFQIPPRAFELFPNLSCIHLLSAGADQIASNPDIPDHLPVVRLIEPGQKAGMIEYVLHAVLHYHRGFDVFARWQSARYWEEVPRTPAAERRVGVLGLGGLGGAVAEALAASGFDVAGWSRSEKSFKGVTSFHGPDGLDAFLGRNEILVAILPLTPETLDLYDAAFFARMPAASYFINVGRGAQLVEADLIAALDSGHLAGATLDVLRNEPPDADNPIFNAKNLILTPHVATCADPITGARVVAENLRRVRDGLPPDGLVSRA